VKGSKCALQYVDGIGLATASASSL